MRYKFTDTELKKVMSNLTILIDTREQANEHVIGFLDKKKIAYEVKKLDFGDYACMLPANSFEGQERAIYFDRDIVIERKNGIDEVAGNLKDDTRILKELAHLNKYDIKYYVFLEEPEMNETLKRLNAEEKKHLKEFMKILESKKVCLKPEGFDFNIRKGNYRSEYQPKSLYARLKTIEARYNTVIRPIDKQFMGSEIYNTFYYYVREVLKNKGFIEEVEHEGN
ncbi:ERCC4 domain-containing protein [Clostridium culturomicium]|uniref:ERCC4 domain-containing protein n=1 Tax=Clostridium culturomicium TaxID=1499683 RepID=UPI00058C74FB|nr:ERCC4 domain-containing protein [Clostridium culturomicium]